MSLAVMHGDGLHVEGLALAELAARFGAPCYVYSRAAEVMIDGDAAHLIRRREEVAQLFALESTVP
jgi:diaminopimelate decarboxylase